MRAAVRNMVEGYIGGGWGKESPDDSHCVPAYVIRGTDFEAIRAGQVKDVPYRFHKRSNVQSRVLCPGDIVFEVSGGSKDQPVGRSLLVDEDVLSKFDAQVIPASFCKKVTPAHGRADARFIAGHLELAWKDRRIVQWQVQSTGISNFNFESFLDQFEVDMPSMTVQSRIAEVLLPYDKLIENNQRRIRVLEEIARALYREWFVEFRFPGHEKVQFVGSPLGDIPRGWEVRLLSDVVDDIVDYRGKTPTKLNGEWSDRGVLALSALNVKDGRLVNLEKSRCVSEDLYSRWMKNPLRSGDILMTSEAPLGELYFLCKERRYCLSQRLFSIRANRQVIAPVILYLCMESEQTQDELRSRASGATVSGIRQSELRKISIAVPPLHVQERAEPIFLKLAELKDALVGSLDNIRRTRDLLLPRLLSGQHGASWLGT